MMFADELVLRLPHLHAESFWWGAGAGLFVGLFIATLWDLLGDPQLSRLRRRSRARRRQAPGSVRW